MQILVYKFGVPPSAIPIRRIVSNAVSTWVASDICRALGMTNTCASLKRLPEFDCLMRFIPTSGGSQLVSTVTDSGLLLLVLTARKPKAQALKRWLVNDVLSPAFDGISTVSDDEADMDELKTIADRCAFHRRFKEASKKASERLGIPSILYTSLKVLDQYESRSQS